jgi:sigma-B regulation protein RsbU (phosphoserine phosphatase)
VDAPSPPEHAAERFDLHALYETSRLLGSSLELDFVLGNLLLTALSKLLVTRGAVLLWRPAEGGYRVAAQKGELALAEGDVLTLEDGEGPGHLAASDAPLWGNALPGPLAERGVALALPLQRGERQLGLLALGPKATGAPFETPEVEFVASLASMSAAAVENALLVEELRQANRDLDGKVQELNTLFDLSQEMGATLEEERLGKLFSYALMGQMAVRRHLFLVREGGTDADGTPLPFRAVAQGHGTPAALAETPALTEALCARRELVRLSDRPDAGEGESGEEAGAPWQALREAGLEIVLPIRQQEETRAALALGPKLTEKPYAPGDIEFLYSLGHLALTSLQNARLVAEQIEMERLEQEIALARDAQERLLPGQLPEVQGAEVAARTVPSREVGGDYYDVIALPGGAEEDSEADPGCLLLAIADVTGKGVPASLLMANLQAALRALVPADRAGESLSLSELAGCLNRVACQNTDAGTFVTFFVATYDPATRTLDYVNAGHNPPMLLRADGGDAGEPERLETGGLLLGVMRGASYETGHASLRPGDALAIFTDGAPEAMTPDGEEFGEKRLAGSLRAHHPGGPEVLLDGVFEDVRAFAGHPPYLSDDLTMIALAVPR